jgi:hypothetical protein
MRSAPESNVSGSIRFWLVGLALLVFSGCADRLTTIEFHGTYEFSSGERHAISEIAEITAWEVKKLLPMLPPRLQIRARTGRDVNDQTGQTAVVIPPDIVYWTVDHNRPGGVEAIARKQLRATLFHEFHHLARATAVATTTLLDHAVTEGMATAFERDFGGQPTPWGDYPESVEQWVAELQALPPDEPREPWLFRHPDGRRWIGFKVGVYLVDRAARSSGRSPAELTTLPTSQVIAMADSDRRP